MLSAIDIEPTTICDLDCPFCFGPVVVRKSCNLPIAVWKEALTKLFRKGVERVVISGGEPTLYENLEELVSFIHAAGKKIVLSTHGRNRRRLLDIAQFCNWIALPIDGVSSGVTKEMRTDFVDYTEILQTGRLLKQANSNLRIKIGTVLTARNIAEIELISKVIAKNLDVCDTWKIYQYTPRRKHEGNGSVLAISDDRFSALQRDLEIPVEVNVVFSSNASRRSAYVFVYHDGSVTLVNVGELFSDVVVGNIREFDLIDFDSVEKSLGENHTRNFVSTYW